MAVDTFEGMIPGVRMLLGVAGGHQGLQRRKEVRHILVEELNFYMDFLEGYIQA